MFLVSATLHPRPYQLEAATCLDHAIWEEGGKPALAVLPVAGGKTVILLLAALAGVERGHDVVVASRSFHVAKQSLDMLRLLKPGIAGGLFTGSKKHKGARILFATAPALARHLHVVENAGLLLIDECDQAYLRDHTKEYLAIIAAATRIGGVTGTPFVLEHGRTVAIFGKGKTFDNPCYLLTKARLRDEGFFHFAAPAPIKPSRVLKIDRKTKVDLSGDFDTKIQASSQPMLSAIAEDTKGAMALLRADQQFLFFGSTTDQCDAQAAAYKSAGLNVEPYHNKLTQAEQKAVIARFRAGELQGLCTVTKVNRGFDLPAIALAVIAFATTSRSKYEQMCGRAQRVFPGKTAAWVLDYGGHGQRFGSANWDYLEAIEFDRREKLRIPAEELAEAIRAGRHDPRCEVRPDNFQDFFEGAVELFDILLGSTRNGRGVQIHYAHSLGYTIQILWPGNGWTALVLRALGCPRFQGRWSPPPADHDELIADIKAADLPSHVMLRRVFDDYWKKAPIIAPVGFTRDGREYVFDTKPVITEERLRQRAHDRMAYADA